MPRDQLATTNCQKRKKQSLIWSRKSEKTRRTSLSTSSWKLLATKMMTVTFPAKRSSRRISSSGRKRLTKAAMPTQKRLIASWPRNSKRKKRKLVRVNSLAITIINTCQMKKGRSLIRKESNRFEPLDPLL